MAYKILTVDDSKTIRMIVKKAFKPYNCELFEGENGVEGLAIAAKIVEAVEKHGGVLKAEDLASYPRDLARDLDTV